MTGPIEISTARAEVADAARALAQAGLVLGTAGNVSARAQELIAITPTGAQLRDLTAAQVTVVDRAGSVREGELAPSSELDLHLGVYERFGAGAVVHTHAPWATALSCVLDELPCIHYQMLLLGGTVRVAPYATFGTPELAVATLDALDGHTAALMANHGAITFADTVADALERARLLEWACELYWRAATLGTPRTLDEEQRVAVVRAALERNYGSTRRIDA